MGEKKQGKMAVNTFIVYDYASSNSKRNITFA